MQKSINIPLRSLDPIHVKDLQRQYPNASFHIEISDDAPEGKMDEATFWSIIAQLDWGRKNIEDILAPAIAILSSYTVEQIYKFDQILAEKLYALDGKKYAVKSGWGKEDDKTFSPDMFLYARCCAVANGKTVYERILNEPSKFPTDLTFEPILYLAEKAYQKKTGKNDYDFLPTVSFETFSNVKAWPDSPSLSDLLNGNAK